MKRIVVVAASMLFALPALASAQNLVAAPVFSLSAQQPQPGADLQPGDAYRVQFDYDATVLAAHPVTFRYYVDDVKVKDFAAADYTVTTANGLNTYTTNAGALPGFTQMQMGAHTLAISAVDGGGLESSKLKLAVSVGFNTPPVAPSGFRLYIPKIAFNSETGEIRLILTPVVGGGS